MYTSVIIITIIYTLITIMIYVKYNLDAKPTETYDIFRDKLDISASEAAYLLDKNCNTLDLILANLLTLIDKGYVKLETLNTDKQREYIFSKTDKEDFSNMKNHEMWSYKTMFSKDITKVNLKDLLNEMKYNNNKLKDIELSETTIKRSLDMELQNQGIIDCNAEKQLFKINKFSIILIIISFLILLISFIINETEFFECSYISFLFSLLIYKSTGLKEEKLTIYGANKLEEAKGFRNYLKEYIITEDKPLYMVNILEYNYIMAIAFGMAKLEQNEFIHKTYKNIQTFNLSFNLWKTIISVIIVLSILSMYII